MKCTKPKHIYMYLNSFPEEQWYGGSVHRLTPSIVHLKRGNIFTIENKSFFVLGGCKSSSKWKDMGLWYDGEEPSEEELRLAYKNLEKQNFQVNYIFTHKYEQTPGLGTVCVQLQKMTELMEAKVQYEKWFAGHWHTDKKVDEKHVYIYSNLTPLY